MGAKLPHDGEAIFSYDGLHDPHIPTHCREHAQRNMRALLCGGAAGVPKPLNAACAQPPRARLRSVCV